MHFTSWHGSIIPAMRASSQRIPPVPPQQGPCKASRGADLCQRGMVGSLKLEEKGEKRRAGALAQDLPVENLRNRKWLRVMALRARALAGVERAGP